MAFVSYAQNFEDVMLKRALKHVERGFYIDVGAQSPDLDSVTRAFSEAGWCGINVEPHPSYYSYLVDRRPRDVNLNCALGQQAGTAMIHLVGATGLSTLDQAIANQHSEAGFPIQHAEVEVRTLNDVWDSHVPPGQPVHFLKVDVEGFEAQVLLGNDWHKHRPWIVLVEATAPNSQVESYSSWEPCLSSAAYEFVYLDGLNRYYVAREQALLKDAFRYPPNVFDDFEVASLSAARGELAQKEVEVAALLDKVAQLAQDVASRDLAHAELQKQQETLQGQHAELQGQLADLQKQQETLQGQHTELQGQLADLHAALAYTRSSLEDAEGRAYAIESTLKLANQDVERLRAELGRVYGSRSWRLTAPLRSILHYVRRHKRASGHEQAP